MALPDLGMESDLTRLVREVLRQLKRQVHPNVALTVHTDFNDDAGVELRVAELAALPGLVLVGPELVHNRFYSTNEGPVVPAAAGFARLRAPRTVDLGFTVVGVAEHTAELLNLLAATEVFFHRNPWLELERSATDASAGRVRYEMELRPDGELKVTSQPNESNIRSFSGAFVIRGFDLEGMAGLDPDVIEQGSRVTEVVLEPPTPIPAAPTEA